GSYDRTRPLFIDPVLSFSTYLGSGGTFGYGIAVDSAGSAYVTGTIAGMPFIQRLYPTDGDEAFVVKLNPAGNALVYSTYLGGVTSGNGIAVDAAGNAYVTGATASTGFPTVNPLQPSFGGVVDAFVAKLNPTGSALVYSTYLGGSGIDGGSGIAVDSAGNAYVTGTTLSTDFPTANPLQATNKAAKGTAFVAVLNPAGSALVYSTYLGGSVQDGGSGIAADSAGNAYVTGTTLSTDFPTANPLQATNKAAKGTAFVAKLNPAGSALVYSTYLGGSVQDGGSGIAADGAGNAYVTGTTDSTDFPTANPLQANCDSCTAAFGAPFVAVLNPTGSAFVYSTYLGGGGGAGNGIAVDGVGNAYVTGNTGADFPIVNPLLPNQGGAFVAELNSAGSALVYSTYLGGTGGDYGYGIAVDAAGNAYVTGETESTDFPTVNPIQATCENCGKYIGGNAFVSKIGAVTFLPASLSFANQMVGTTSPAQPVTLSNTGSANLTISSIAIAGSVTGDFAVAATGTTCSTSAALAAGTNCTISVTFTPTIVGSESASLSVSDSDTDNPLTVPLSGAGVLLPAPNVSPKSLSFNNQLVGSTSTPQPVTVTNTGTLALDISALTISSGWTQTNNCL